MTNIKFFDCKTKLSNTPYTQRNVLTNGQNDVQFHKQTFSEFANVFCRPSDRFSTYKMRSSSSKFLIQCFDRFWSLSCKKKTIPGLDFSQFSSNDFWFFFRNEGIFRKN